MFDGAESETSAEPHARKFEERLQVSMAASGVCVCFVSVCISLCRNKEQKKQLEAIRKSCRNFFIEVVSGLCFGQSNAPEDELVEMLLNIVFTERGEGEGGGEGAKTRDFSPYTDDMKKSDKSPVIRSFLLQLLLEHKYVHISF